MSIATALLATALAAAGQTITYSLPKTVLVLELSTTREEWHAGPYSAYAKDLLEIEAVERDSTACSISSVKLSDRTEADQGSRHTLELSSGAESVYLSMTRHGLLAGSDVKVGRSKARKQTVTVSSAPQLGSKIKGSGDVKAEARAAAQRIAELREMRYNILIGNTDATYSGDALRAAVDELRRMEEELLRLFTGYYTTSTMDYSFEVIPQLESTHTAMVYEAFCLSQKDGIVPAGSIEGVPYYLELNSEGVVRIEQPQKTEEEEEVKKGKKNNEAPAPVQYITYRIPAICTVRLTDGDKTLTEVRMPVYQLGIEEQYPIFN